MPTAIVSINQDTLVAAIASLKSIVNDEFKCAICLDVCKNPHVVPECLHRFCGECISQSIRKCAPQCPECRTRIVAKRHLRQDDQFDKIMKTVLAVVDCFDSLIVPEEAATVDMRSVRNNVAKMKNASTTATSAGPPKVMSSSNVSKPHADEQSNLLTPPPNALISPRAVADSPTSSGQAISVVASPAPSRRRKKLAVRKNYKVTKDSPPFHIISRITTATSKSDQYFRDRLQDLKDFKALHGHCNTKWSADGDNQLYKWCSAIRKSHRLLGSGVRAPILLTNDRMDALRTTGLLLLDGAEEEAKKQAPKISPQKEKTQSSSSMVSSKAKVSQPEQHAPDSHIERDQKTRKHTAKKGKITASVTVRNQGKKSHHRRAFDLHMEELTEFMKEHGHSRVPSSHNDSPKLRDWCYQIRYSYGRMKTGLSPHYRLNSERIARLNAIGFDFEFENKCNISKKPSTQSVEAAGIATSAKKKTRGRPRLTPKQIKSDKGHYSPDIVPSLSTRACAVTSSGEGSSDEEAKPDLATSAIGTTAQTKACAKRRSFDEAFQVKVEAFIEYKRLHGHQNVDRKENKPLYDWCYRVQNAYAQKQVSEPMCIKLSDERETILRAVGFKFHVETKQETYIAQIRTQCNSSVDVVTAQENADNTKTQVTMRRNTRPLRSTRTPDQVSRDGQQFIDWVEQLQTYKNKHGNCNVSRVHDMGLFTWCSEIRKSYSLESGSSQLTDGRIHALQELGFLFTNEALETGDCSIQQVKSKTQMKEQSAQTRDGGDNDDIIRKSKRSRTSIQTRRGEFDWGVKAATANSKSVADNDDVKLSISPDSISSMMVYSNDANVHHDEETTARKSKRKRKGPAAKYGD